MARLMWTDSFALGITSIDEQHKRFLDALNELLDAQDASGQACLASTLIDRLKAYAAEHFHVEEGYMQAFAYPGYEEHLMEHEHFLDTVRHFEDACANGGVESAKLLDYLLNWMAQHLTGVDRQMGRYLEEYLR
ncbi:MAG: hemerythrin family protein [Desulfovibrio sp.]|jgi:hemerythrin|nr:hemerythrin family protein [Desulfovibrio sp.]